MGITCDKETFVKVRREEKFAYIVALARAVNALNAVHSLLPVPPQAETPERVRNGMNSYFFFRFRSPLRRTEPYTEDE